MKVLQTIAYCILCFYIRLTRIVLAGDSMSSPIIESQEQDMSLHAHSALIETIDSSTTQPPDIVLAPLDKVSPYEGIYHRLLGKVLQDFTTNTGVEDEIQTRLGETAEVTYQQGVIHPSLLHPIGRRDQNFSQNLFLAGYFVKSQQALFPPLFIGFVGSGESMAVPEYFEVIPLQNLSTQETFHRPSARLGSLPRQIDDLPGEDLKLMEGYSPSLPYARELQDKLSSPRVIAKGREVIQRGLSQHRPLTTILH